MTNIRKLAVCLLNISEASNKSLVERIARSAVVKQDDHQLETTILNVFSDEIYNRSVITIAGTTCLSNTIGSTSHIIRVSVLCNLGTLQGVERGVVRACCAALDNLPAIRHHHGGHPRQGTVDLIPIHPVTNDATLEECAEVARSISQVGSNFKMFDFLR